MPKKTMVNLKFDEIPARWYNILPDLPVPLPPPQNPKDGPSRVKNLPNLMIGECLKQEFLTERWIDIPGGIMDLYAKAGRGLSSGRQTWRKGSRHRRGCTTKANSSAPPAVIKLTPRWLNAGMPNSKGLNESPLRREPGNGALRFLMRRP